MRSWELFNLSAERPKRNSNLESIDLVKSHALIANKVAHLLSRYGRVYSFSILNEDIYVDNYDSATYEALTFDEQMVSDDTYINIGQFPDDNNQWVKQKGLYVIRQSSGDGRIKDDINVQQTVGAKTGLVSYSITGREVDKPEAIEVIEMLDVILERVSNKYMQNSNFIDTRDYPKRDTFLEFERIIETF